MTAAPATGPRRRGLSVRLKLTLSYVAFLMAAWAAFVVVLEFVLHYVPDTSLVTTDGGFAPRRSDLSTAAYPVVAVATGVLLVVGLVGGWLLAGRMLRPLSAVTAAASAAAGGSLSHRVALPGPDDELRRLADVFDDMLARIERSFDEQRRFAGNASHELRTPHAAARTMLEVAARDPERDVDRLISRLTELNERSIATIDALLVLARADQVAPARGPCDLADLVRAALRRLPDGLPAVHLSLSLLPAPVLGVPALLEHLVGNLVENAHRHNVDGGSVIVRTAATAGGARLEVLNTGPVLAPDVVGTLTEPFVRGAGRVRAAGTGLGLAIVASVARVHEGELVLTAREGGGLHVRLELPAGRPR